jgi:hypothetical protein
LVVTKYKNKHDSLNDKYVPHLVLIHSFLLKTVIGYGVFQILRYFSYLLVIKLNAFCVLFFDLNPLDNKKDISLYVLFRTFQVNFQDISVTLQLKHFRVRNDVTNVLLELDTDKTQI